MQSNYRAGTLPAMANRGPAATLSYVCFKTFKSVYGHITAGKKYTNVLYEKQQYRFRIPTVIKNVQVCISWERVRRKKYFPPVSHKRSYNVWMDCMT